MKAHYKLFIRHPKRDNALREPRTALNPAVTLLKQTFWIPVVGFWDYLHSSRADNTVRRFTI